MTVAGGWRTNRATSPYPDWELFSVLPRASDLANENLAPPTEMRLRSKSVQLVVADPRSPRGAGREAKASRRARAVLRMVP